MHNYKDHFNCNIDDHWTGAILRNVKMITDNCTHAEKTLPARSVSYDEIFGLSFDKYSPTSYYRNCDTYMVEDLY